MRTADRLVEAILLDIWPDSPGAMVDFGLDRGDVERKYRCLHHAVRVEGVTADELHKAMVDGKLTEFVRSRCPDQEIVFDSAWDFIRDDDEDEENEE